MAPFQLRLLWVFLKQEEEGNRRKNVKVWGPMDGGQQATLMWDFEGLAVRRKELGNLYISSIVPGYM